MNRYTDFDQLLESWLDDGAEVAPERFVWAAIDEAELTPQRGAWRATLRGMIMRMQPTALVAGVAATVLLAVVLYFAFSAPPVGTANPSASPSTSPSATTSDNSPSDSAEITPRQVASTTIDLGGALTGLQATEDALYAATEDRIVRIDPASGDATTLLTVPDTASSCSECTTGPEYAFAVGEGSIWVAYHRDAQSLVRRFDLSTGDLQAEILVGAPDGGGAGATDVTVAFGSVWTVQCHSGTVARIDPVANQQADLVQIADGAFCRNVSALAADTTSLWASAMVDDGTAQRTLVYRIDPETNAPIGSVQLEGAAAACGRFASDPDGGVVINSCPASGGSALIRIDSGASGSAPGPASAVRLSGYLGDPAVIDGTIWVPRVSSRPSGLAVLVGIDSANGEVVDLVQLGSNTRVVPRSAIAMTVAFDSVWVGGDATSLLRIPLSELDG